MLYFDFQEDCSFIDKFIYLLNFVEICLCISMHQVILCGHKFDSKLQKCYVILVMLCILSGSSSYCVCSFVNRSFHSFYCVFVYISYRLLQQVGLPCFLLLHEYIDLVCVAVLTVPDVVASLSFVDVTDTSFVVVWTRPYFTNGILIGICVTPFHSVSASQL